MTAAQTRPDYLHPHLAVREISPAKGRGLVAQQTILLGDLLLVANPLAMVDLTLADSQGKDPHLVLAEALVLAHGDKLWPMLAHLASNATTLSTLEPMLRTNAFQIPNANAVAFYLQPSYVNHACNPNTSMVFDREGVLFLRAARTLAPGSEVTLRYFATTEVPFAGRRELSSQWGFSCDCEFCLLEKNVNGLSEFIREMAPRVDAACAAFFERVRLGERAPTLVLEGLVRDIDEKIHNWAANNVQRTLLRSLFASAYQVTRAALERAGAAPSDVVRMQDIVLELFDAVEPGSNEHCKAACLCAMYARAFMHGHEQKQRVACVLQPAFRARFGHDPEMLRAMVMQMSKELEEQQ